ncbi:calcium-binding protein [Rhizobium sp. G187]|uniref:calcium-binding protein n=1 Tax=Rhizobium sp. G187 TaxID=3451352 RepID=UPI003EE7CE28
MFGPTLDQDDSVKLGHGDLAAAKAPARKFDLKPEVDRALVSPGIFSVLAIGVGAYLGRLRDAVNPAPNAELGDQGKGTSPEEDPIPAVEEAPLGPGFDVAAFWQELQKRFEDVVEQLPASRRLYSSIRFNSEDFVLEGPYASRPFQGVSIDVAANGFQFSVPQVVSPRNGLPFLTGSRGGASANPGPAEGGPDDTDSNGGGGTPPGNGGPTTPPVTPVNRAPLSRGPVYLGAGLVNLSMLLVWADFARAAIDPDGDKLQISAIRATSGEIRTHGSDAWIYVPERDKLGMVTLTFTIGDGKTTIQGQAFLDLRQHPDREISGTDGDDVLIGTPGKDLIDAGAGGDIVYGRESDDLVLGGAGNDLLIGGDGRDVLHGGTGDDRIFGGNGDDVLFGEDGNDVLFGEAGRDSLNGGAGDDVLSGGDGHDRLFGETGRDVLSGEDGDDVLDGGADADTLGGGAGADVVVGGDGDDVYVAGILPVLSLRSLGTVDPDPSKPEEVAPAVASTSDGDDVIHGGEGADTYDAHSAVAALSIDLEAGVATGAEIGTDRLTSIENVVAGEGNDIIAASSAVNVLYGGSGDDHFVFGSVASIDNNGDGFDEIRDFNVGDKVDLSRLERELGRLYFDDGETSLSLDEDEHRTLVKLYKKMIDDDDAGHHVLQLVTDIDGDADYEIVIISAHDLNADDLILTAFHLPGSAEGLVA